MTAPAAQGVALPTSPAEHPSRGAYLHVPFCLVHCPYCDFNAHAGLDSLKRPYVEALIAEIRHRADGRSLDTVHVGGGTPTELAPQDLALLLSALDEAFGLAPGAEVGIEANPESIDRATLDALVDAGFTRLSLGVQSLDAGVLRWLGRTHSPDGARAAIAGAKAAGFASVGADLIFGSPVETDTSWRTSLQGVLDAGVDHLSTYALTVEERTPLALRVARGLVPAPDDDAQADRYDLAAEVIPAAGLHRYELSNWARPGQWSRHNLGYWTGQEYLGFGAGAHGYARGRRSWNLSPPRRYVQLSPCVQEGEEELDPAAQAAEAMAVGLRLAGGVNRVRFAARWGCDPLVRWGRELSQAEDLGLVRTSGPTLSLTDRGFFLWAHVARSLLPAGGAGAVTRAS